MRRSMFALAILSTATILPSFTFGQSSSIGLATNLTASSSAPTNELGSFVAVSGDTLVASSATGVYVFPQTGHGWPTGTQSAVLSPSDQGGIALPPVFLGGQGLAINGDTVVAAGVGKAYLFAKPTSGWADKTETAQLILSDATSSNPISAVAVDGDTVVVSTWTAAYIFVKPGGGWQTTSAYQAKLSLPGERYLWSVAISGDTIVVGYYYDGKVHVFEKPGSGWATTTQPAATLTRSNSTPGSSFGWFVTISGDTIAVGAPDANLGVSPSAGSVDIFEKPQTGWANETETAELTVPAVPKNYLGYGTALALDSRHLVVGGQSDTFYVYSKPVTGWKSGAWPSQMMSDYPGNGINLGISLALAGDTVIAGAPYDRKLYYDPWLGAAYAFNLFPNSIQISSNFLAYPDMSFGSTEVLPLTITNIGSKTLNFTTTMDSPNYQVVKTADNTCQAGVGAGQSCVLPIEYNPEQPGLHTNHITLTAPDQASIRVVALRGLAAGVGPASEKPLNFEVVPVGSSATLPLVIENFGVPGSPTVAVSFNNPNYFLASGGGCTTTGVAEGHSCTLQIKFAPVAGGTHNAAVIITPSTGAASMVKLLGSTLH